MKFFQACRGVCLRGVLFLSVLMCVPAFAEPVAPQSEPEQTILSLERAAMTRWIHGDPGGFLELSAPDVVYFDPALDTRLDGLDALRAYYKPFTGKVRQERFVFLNPQVQMLGDAGAVLTYNYVSYGKSGKATRWNCTEVYRRDPAGWRIIQSHWSYTNLKKMWDAKVEALKKDMGAK